MEAIPPSLPSTETDVGPAAHIKLVIICLTLLHQVWYSEPRFDMPPHTRAPRFNQQQGEMIERQRTIEQLSHQVRNLKRRAVQKLEQSYRKVTALGPTEGGDEEEHDNEENVKPL